MSIRLGLLDVGLNPGGVKTAYQLLSEVTELAGRAEQRGYSRYWLAEHHGPDMSYASPELLLPVVAGLTERIRLGAAVILMLNYSAHKVKANFQLLSGLFPDRLDLGLGRGGVRVGPLAHNLVDGRSTGPDDRYQEKLEEIEHGLFGDARDAPDPPPTLWLMGSGKGSAVLAAQRGTAYSHSLFFSFSVDDRGVLTRYANDFQPGPSANRPRYNLAVSGICAESEEQARAQLPECQKWALQPNVVGDPKQCRAQLLELAESYGTDEIIFLDLCTEYTHRRRSIELLAEALELMPSREVDVAAA